MMAILSFPKIIAAAVNGPAIGIGVTLLFHCDLCYCTSNATFWIPFTRLALGWSFFFTLVHLFLVCFTRFLSFLVGLYLCDCFCTI